MHRCIMAPVFVLGLSATAQADNCTARFQFIFGQVRSGTMTASSGVPCDANTTRTGAKTVIKSVRVTSPPKNGSASAHSTGVVYRSKPGFKGSDAFTFTVFGDGDAGSNLTATVQMSVNVQ
jgi:hypothetical protein